MSINSAALDAAVRAVYKEDPQGILKLDHARITGELPQVEGHCADWVIDLLSKIRSEYRSFLGLYV